MQNLRKEARFPYAGTKNLLLFLWSTLVYLSMKYRVNGIEIPLDRKETAAAKRMVAKFMEEVEKNSKYTGNTSLYFTTLILMQVLSQEALDHIDSETLQKYREKKACRINSDRFFLHDVRRSNNCFSFFCFIITQIKMLFCTCHCDIK